MKKHYILLILTSFLITNDSSGFGRKGHQLISAIAWKYLTPKTKERVKLILGTENLVSASTWMDDIRNNHDYDSLKSWHYIDTDIPLEINSSRVSNIMEALSLCRLKLRDATTSKQEQLFYLKCLIHLVGDIHQPLHAGYQRDKGGNAVQVIFDGHPSNLHKVWDTDILEYFHDDDSTISGLISDSLYTGSCSIDSQLWLSQSENTLKEVYDYHSTTLSKEYIEKSHGIIRNRIAVAGIRLACLLNSIYDAAKR